MPTRKKTVFEKLFSFNQYRRRFGANDIAQKSINFDELKSKVVSTQKSSFTHGSKPNIKEHLNDLKNEFNGKSELEYYHAELNVLLRRDYKVKETFKKFSELWEKESSYLIENLNTRWLIAAADSYIDHDSNEQSRAYAFSAVCLVNTCKLYETERFATDTQKLEFKTNFLEELKSKRVALFDGTSAFAVGTCDTLRNMRWRLDELNSPLPSYQILKEIFLRINKSNTIYKRMAKHHINKNTIWW